jgi:hypothetical protein
LIDLVVGTSKLTRVGENILFTAIIWPDETKALVRHELLYATCWHLCK